MVHSAKSSQFVDIVWYASMSERCEALVIGGGFFGLYLAEYLALRWGAGSVVLCERGPDFMTGASYANQARVHQGYHYPRSRLTAFRSRLHFPRFVAEFPACIDDTFVKLYAVAANGSKVSAVQFRRFAESIGAPIERAPEELRKLFDRHLVEDVFLTREYAFDAVKLRGMMLDRVRRADVVEKTCTEVHSLRADGVGSLTVETTGPRGSERFSARHVFNCTYCDINQVLAASSLPLIPLKHELAELALIHVPEPLTHLGVTVMCGPFFSTMPFPSAGLHSFSHVRYTPHASWADKPGTILPGRRIIEAAAPRTSYPLMIRDAARYLPILAKSEYRSSLWQVKTVLPRSETDDSRPILFRPHHGLENHHVVLGGKIDNVYDAVWEIEAMLAGEPAGIAKVAL
jgi:glycine/D-amino acid oxidase-like deaminating enzyme